VTEHLEPIAIYVHGVGNKPSAAVLKHVWDKALFGVDMGARTRMAYWADLIYPEPLPADLLEEPLLPAVTTMSDVEVEPTEAFVNEAAEELGRTAEERQFIRSLATVMAPKTATSAAEDPEPAISPMVLGLLPRPLRLLALRRFLKRFFSDVNAYVFGGKGNAMRERLRRELSGNQAPLIIIGHSLGSMISYDVLSQPEFADLDVALFLTVGSPLGITRSRTSSRPRWKYLAGSAGGPTPPIRWISSRWTRPFVRNISRPAPSRTLRLSTVVTRSVIMPSTDT
jgi:hypothetical protein